MNLKCDLEDLRSDHHFQMCDWKIRIFTQVQSYTKSFLSMCDIHQSGDTLYLPPSSYGSAAAYGTASVMAVQPHTGMRVRSLSLDAALFVFTVVHTSPQRHLSSSRHFSKFL